MVNTSRGVSTHHIMAEQTHKPTIVIAGAGLSGLSLALGLARTGNYSKINLLERRNEFLAQGAAFGLAPNGRKALIELLGGTDLIDEMREAGVSFPVGSYTVILLPWWILRDALLRRARESELIDIHLGCEVISVVDDPQKPYVSVSCSGSPKVFQGSILVGADGVNSCVRGCLGLPKAERVGITGFRGHCFTSRNSVLRTLVTEASPSVAPLMIMKNEVIFNSFSFFPRSDLLIWSINTERQELADSVQKNIEAFDLLRKYADDETWHILENFRQETDESVVQRFEMKIQDMSDDQLAKYEGGWGGKGRVVLIGDAAHAMRPAMGQGGSMAFEDCAMLCRMLSREDTSNVISDYYRCQEEIVLKFESARLDRVKIIHQDQTEQSNKSYKKDSVGWTDEFRDWVYEGI